MTNEREVIACVALVASTLRQEVTPLLLEGFCLALADLTPHELRQAIERALRECKFMPSPAELRAFAGHRRDRLEAPYHAPALLPAALYDWNAIKPWPKEAKGTP